MKVMLQETLTDGLELGDTVGLVVGDTVGLVVGDTVGFLVGDTVGFKLADTDGLVVGDTLVIFVCGIIGWYRMIIVTQEDGRTCKLTSMVQNGSHNNKGCK